MDIKEKIKGHLQAAEMRQGTTDYTPYVDALMSDIESEIQSRLSFMVDEGKNKYKECQAWHDGALDWRELEVKRAQNRISELETEIAKFSPDKVRNILKKYLPENYFEGSFIERITNEICEE